MGLLFVIINLVGLHRVSPGATGVASGLVNVGQQAGGSIGLASLCRTCSPAEERPDLPSGFGRRRCKRPATR